MAHNVIDNRMYIDVGGKMLRMGYTTGTCATAASKAAAEMLITGGDVLSVTVITPKGIVLDLPIENITRGDGWVRCPARSPAQQATDPTTCCGKGQHRW